MTENPTGTPPSTPESVKATAQTSDAVAPNTTAEAASIPCPGEGTRFLISEKCYPGGRGPAIRTTSQPADLPAVEDLRA